MPALETVAQYLEEARRLLQDEITPYRYPDDDLVDALNIGLMEARRLRADLFLPLFDLQWVNPSGTIAVTTPVTLDPMYRPALLYYMCGRMQLRDDEFHHRQQSFGDADQVHGSTADDTVMTVCAPNDRLLQTLRVHAPGATDALIDLELFNTMDEFFRRTSAWRFDSDIDMTEGMFEYGFVTPSDTIVVRLLGVMHQNTPVAPSSATSGVVQTSIGTIESSQVFPDGDVAVDPHHSDLEGGLFTYAVYRPNYITLTSLPDAEARQYPLKVTLALSLAQGCLECECGDWALEEWMWDMFFHDFLDGTLARLYAMPAKPWSSSIHAQYHGKRFRNAMAYRKQEALKGFTFGVPTWRFPRWTA